MHLIRDNESAVEADLRREYGVDLGALWRGELSIRLLAYYIEHLPVGSATWALSADVPYGWSLTDLLLADVFHALTGNPHPSRPDPSRKAKAAAHEEMVQRLVEQRDRIAAQRAQSTSTEEG